MMTDKEGRMNRREFVKYSAVTSITAGAVYGIVLKTDALGQNFAEVDVPGGFDEQHSYTYHESTAP